MRYSFAGQVLSNYKIDYPLQLQLFQANRDQNGIVKNAINPPILARYVKLNPRGWYRHISMRVEYYGCAAGKSTSSFIFAII